MIYPLTKLFLFCVALTIVHELGHLAMAKAFKVEVVDYRFSSVSLNWQNLKKGRKCLIALAGPFATAIVALGLLSFNLRDYSLVALLFSLWDLLPFGSSDGQVAIRLLRRWR